MAKEDFPRLLREWRKANGLTQKALAERLKIQHTTIGKYEQGRGVPSVEIRDKLILETGLNATDIPCGQHYIKIENRPFTEAEQSFAAEHHGCVIHYLRSQKLDYDEWYEICVFAYLKAVQIWFSREALHKYSFITIAYRKMTSAVKDVYRAKQRRPKMVSLNDIIPNTDGMTYGETLCDPHDCVRT